MILGGEYVNIFRQDQENYDLRVYLDDKRSSSHWALYLQDEFQILNNLKLNAGIRYDHFGTFGGTTNPRIALVYLPFEKTILKLIYGQAFRSPNVYELYYKDGVSAKASPDLNPETIQTGELVLQQYLGLNLWGTAVLYYNRINNLITQEIDPVDKLLIYRNVDKVDGKGLELEVEGKWKNGLQGRVSYALQETKDRETGKILTDSPKHLVKLNGILPVLRKRLFLSMEEQYTSQRKTLAGQYTNGFFITNMTLFSQNYLKGLDVSVSIYNLFDKKYSDPGGPEHRQDKIEQDGRSFRIKATYNF